MHLDRTAPVPCKSYGDDASVSSLPPPAELAWLTEAIGADATLRLIEEHGGTRVYVPKSINQGSAARLGVSLAAARALGEQFGGDYIDVPIARAWRVRLYRAGGLSHSKIARRLGISERAVRRLLFDAGMTQQQFDLFG